MDPVDQPSAVNLSRGQLVAIFSGLTFLGLVIGIGAAELTGAGDDSRLIGATAASSPTPTADQAPEQTADDVEEVSTPTPSPSGKPNYRAIPEDATSEPGLDFGYLTRVVSKDGAVTLRFDRATFYTGDEAKSRNQGKTPDNDYFIENTNPAQRLFVLDPRASIVAANRLLTEPGEVGRQDLTVAQFVQNSTRVLTGSTTDLPVWLRHTDGLTGPVTALAEQYLP
jgi:hypothetical protein